MLDPTTHGLVPEPTGRTASPILNYLRGDRTNEAQYGVGSLRDRTSALSDILHTTPIYVAGPRDGNLFTHHASTYPAFATANNARSPRVYASANDGMLHAFDAATGEEIFAFVPSKVIDKMRAHTQIPYYHQYMVDGPLTVRDAYYSGAWHTVLACSFLDSVFGIPWKLTWLDGQVRVRTRRCRSISTRVPKLRCASCRTSRMLP